MFAAIEQAIAKPNQWRPDANQQFIRFAENRSQYHALLKFFSSFSSQPIGAPEILIGGLAVYGWMPAMMPNRAVKPNAETVLAKISSGEAVQPGDFFFLTSPSATSKFLHFLAPKRFFVCDSRVRRALGWKSITMTRYLDYCSVLASPCAATLAQIVMPCFPQVLQLDPTFSAGCAIEGALFCIAASDREIAVRT